MDPMTCQELQSPTPSSRHLTLLPPTSAAGASETAISFRETFLRPELRCLWTPVCTCVLCMFNIHACLLACVHDPASLVELCPFLRQSSFLLKQVLGNMAEALTCGCWLLLVPPPPGVGRGEPEMRDTDSLMVYHPCR